MINEVQALRLLDEANPVPDLEAYMSEADITAHLTTLIERSSEMTQLKARTDSSTTGPSRLRLALAGGLAVVIVVSLAIIPLTSDDTSETASSGDLTSADLVGTWTPASEGVSALFLYFDENGRYALSDSFGSFDERTFETGTWTFDGGELVFMTDSSSTSCAGTAGRYQARRLDDERILLTPIVPDPCAERQRGNGMGALRSYPLNPQFSDN